MNNLESLYSRVVKRYGQRILNVEGLPRSQQDHRFAMSSNGFFLGEDGKWNFFPQATAPIASEFKGQETAFFGPGGKSDFFEPDLINSNPILIAEILKDPKITDVVRKYRELDEDQAARIAFILGGTIRYLKDRPFPVNDKAAGIKERVEFVAGMTALGERKSGLAIASAMAKYVISGGPIEDNKDFTKAVFLMGEAIKDDPIEPLDTKDLGLSQVARLRNFISTVRAGDPQPFASVEEYIADFEGFPTVGAEFHLPMSAADEFPNLWQRLALLNMSQYQLGSYIQLSRNDREVIEVRMNPSIYPVTIANWRHMLGILPELNQTFFTATINRSTNYDFRWRYERSLIKDLRAIGLLTYASIFENTPQTAGREEIDFGSVYLGQTVKLNEDGYSFTGNWGGGKGEYGQMGIYAGFGNSFPSFMYYLTFALESSDALRSISSELVAVKNLDDALSLESYRRRRVFNVLQDVISRDESLNKAHGSGIKIQDLLS